MTPLKDGMNLIAKEYIATRTDKTGVLILSEMAGASKELGEAIIVNPNNIEEIADALKEALDMPKEEQINRNDIMQTRLKRYDVSRWAGDFFKELLSLKDLQKRYNAKLISRFFLESLITDFSHAKRRLIFLDYDGTLVPFTDNFQLAKPDDELLGILQSLAGDPKTDLVLISGRDRETLHNWFRNLEMEMVAEHGVWLKEKNEDWRMFKQLTNAWKPSILPILEVYADRLPGSVVEEKEFSIAWHYRKADAELASMRAKELADYLVNFTANIDVQILPGSKVIEVKNAGISKGAVVPYWIEKKNFDFILAIGDDWTDEDIFKVLPATAYSIRVGMTQTYARFNILSYREVRKLLEQLNIRIQAQ